MPPISPFLLIIIAASGGWLITSFFITLLFGPNLKKNILGLNKLGIIPSLQPQIAQQVAMFVEQNYLKPEMIEKKTSDPLFMELLRPEIEKHIDHFLKTKLSEAFPLLFKFMGEKTQLKLKEAFMSEVEIIFPEMVNKLGANLLLQFKETQFIENEINSIPTNKLKNALLDQASGRFLLFKLLGAGLGAVIGIIQWLVLSCTA
jgi:uncharacterized membrane protein YheB (UPF0754 family)